MSKSEIRIAAASMHISDGPSKRTPLAYRVEGMPENLTAELFCHRGDKWCFSVFQAAHKDHYGQEIVCREGTFDSPELALEGLKKWLLGWALDQKPAVPKSE